MELDHEQQKALTLLESGRNVFLTGKAGCGKSTVIREFIRRNCKDKNIAVIAPTGIAALQLGGCTIHHFFEIPIQMENLDALDELPLSPQRRETIRHTDVIVIDEISMVRSDVFCAFYRRLQQLDIEKLPQIVVVGDFQQLPPIVTDPGIKKYLVQEYQGIFAFETEAWKTLDFAASVLYHAHRQAGEENAFFLTVLNSLRCVWDYELANCPSLPINLLSTLNEIRLTPLPSVIRLCVYQCDADGWNQQRRAELPSKERVYQAVVIGNMSPADYPVEKELRLKPGMRIMLRSNLYDENGVLVAYNGDMGKVDTCDDEYVKVCFDRFEPQQHTIRPHTWQLFDYEVKFDSKDDKYHLKAVELGSYRQIPLIPAYAITVHKAQGLSLPALQFDRGRGCFEHGQLYTALSRCRSILQLYLASPLSVRDIKFNPKVALFCEELELEPELLLTAMVSRSAAKRWTQPRLIAFLRDALMTYRAYRLNPPKSKTWPDIPPTEIEADARVFYTLCRRYQPEQKDTVLAILRKYRTTSESKT